MRRQLYELGELPPLGEVPERMYAQVIRRERYGEPARAFQVEVVDVPPVRPGDVLVLVMAAGINYNNVWAALGQPLDVITQRQRRGEPEDFHIGGSDAAGIVWAVGEGVRQVSVGDHVVLSGCQWDEQAADIRLGVDPVASTSQGAWGYEINYGSFAQFARVREYQCHPKPPQLSWAEAACFMVTAATAYRQLCGWPPHVVRPGAPVLIWGGAGGVGSMAIQITRIFGGVPLAVVSSPERGQHCLRLGARGVIDRTEFDHWGRLPSAEDTEAAAAWTASARAFARRVRDLTPGRALPRIVLEHTGRDTLPTSMYVCDNAGMVVICGGTTGYNGDLDLRFLWTRQKRLQGSHYASVAECRAVTELVAAKRLDPCLSVAVGFDEIGALHQQMYENVLPPGNAAVLVNATSDLAGGGPPAVLSSAPAVPAGSPSW